MTLRGMARKSRTASREFTIRFAPGPARALIATVARQKPETGAVLGGSSDDPFRVIDLRFIPPRRNADGLPDASQSDFAPDMDLVNHILMQEWIPQGMTILGYVHSHPGNFGRLSNRDDGTNTTDVPAIKADLRAMRAAGFAWDYALMPVITGAATDHPEIHGWVVTLDDPEPFPATIVMETEDTAIMSKESYLDTILACANRHQQLINAIVADRESPRTDCEVVIAAIRHARDLELEAIHLRFANQLA